MMRLLGRMMPPIDVSVRAAVIQLHIENGSLMFAHNLVLRLHRDGRLLLHFQLRGRAAVLATAVAHHDTVISSAAHRSGEPKRMTDRVRNVRAIKLPLVTQR